MPRRSLLLGLIVALLVLTYWWWAASIDESTPQYPQPASASASAVEVRRVPGMPIQDTKNEAKAASVVSKTPLEEAQFLWPHLRDAGPSPAQLAEVHAQWSRLAQRYPHNIFLPQQYVTPMSAQQVQQVRERLDDSTAMEADLAALQQAYRYADAAQTPAPLPSMQSLTPQEIGMRRNYFDTRILQLESLLQLVDFWFTSEVPSAAERATAAKEQEQWKSELEIMRGARAALPSY